MMVAADSFICSRGCNNRIQELFDTPLMPSGNQRLVFSVSSQIARPPTLVADDMGWTAACTVINRAAAAGARPIGLAVGVVTSDPFDVAARDQVFADVSEAASAAGVALATLDEERMPAWVSIETCVTAFAVGAAPRRPRVHLNYLAAGDIILVGTPAAKSPRAVAPLNHLIGQVLKEVPGVIFVCDASHGGIERARHDIGARTGLRIRLDSEGVSSADTALFFVRAMNVVRALSILQRHSCLAARAIGRIEE